MERFRRLWGQRDDQRTWERLWADKLFKCSICVIAFISVVILVVLLLLFEFSTGSVASRGKREVMSVPVHHDHSSNVNQHHFGLNMFWKYANYTAKQHAPNKNCYVCAQASFSAAYPYPLSPEPVEDHELRCIMIRIAGPGSECSQKIFRRGEPLECGNVTSASPILSLSSGGKKKIWPNPGQKFKECYQSRKGVNFMGILEGCKVIHNVNCDSPTGMSDHIAGGAFLLYDYYWLCGHTAYPSLPVSWRGVCALVKLRARIRIGYVSKKRRQKRNLGKKDGDTWWRHDISDIPTEHRVIAKTAQFWKAFLIHNAVTDSMNWINRIHYELFRFANDTQLALTFLKTEVGALRQMTLENRMALDAILAEEGGVCVKIGKECCTFVPAYDADDGSISKVLTDMTKVRDDLWQDEQAKNKGIGWSLDWISDAFRNAFGNIFGPILKFLAMIFATLLVAMMIIGCLMKCIRVVLGRFVQSIVEAREEREYVELLPSNRKEYQNLQDNNVHRF
ncbi:syncytin-2-like isoform X1 [Megalobrama amblycephala]|uniref:syncytin-2-like isoform X1 n=1 Tax=Megalobrama amblycephala TaxID=75352 RepID=UPI00201404A3|nr:syncytin-2-like isoform X1 [Megalobrama amblycephala]XP_048067279.1 syncytin-2-like isoform X1 [Megalobrama amblycephala]XP_048067287.1 syncytin-2-like isoform X1 [Megalobrama amblycephala]